MPIATTGTGYSGGTRLIGAEGGGTGTATVTGETLVLDTIYAAREGGEGTLTLEGGAAVTVRDLSGDPATVFPANLDVGVTDDPGQPSDGTLEVAGGSVLRAVTSTVLDQNGFLPGAYETLRIGQGEGATGVALVSGAGSAIETGGGAPRINVGHEGGDGTLTVENGAEIRVFDIEIGRSDGSAGVGRAVIDGAGSRIVSSSAYGSYVDGSNYAGASPTSDVGRGAAGVGYLTIRNGGQFLTENVDGESDPVYFRIARDYGGYGRVDVTGAGSSLDLVQTGPAFDSYAGGPPRLTVGQGGQGVVAVSDSAEVNVVGEAASIIVSNGRGGQGQSSRLEITGGGTVTVDSKGYLDSIVALGWQAGTDGSATITGKGSRLVVRSDEVQFNSYLTGTVSVGADGAGDMTVSYGASVQARQVSLGAFGSESGTGTLDVTSGGRVDVLSYAATPYQGLRIADGPGTTGIVTVSGEGSALVSRGAGGDGGQGASRILVGRDGDGTLDVTDGGYVAGFFFEVGRGQDGRPGTGTLNISGEGSLLKGSDEFGTFRAFDDEGNVTGESPDSTFMQIGREAGAEGEVNVTDGGTLLLETDPDGDKVFPGMRLGQAQGAVGRLTVDGEGSGVRIVQNAVSDSAGEQGAPFIELGGDSGDSPTGGTGLVTISNGGAIELIGNNATVRVGKGDPGEAGAPRTSTLTVETGGTVRLEAEEVPEGAFMDVGRNAGSNGAVTVTGDGSELALVSRLTADAIADGEFASVLTVGRTGTGVLEVRDGGRVTLDAGGALFPGLNVARSGEDESTGQGSVTISGAGSAIEIMGTNDTSFASSGFIVVGRDSGDEGVLVIEEGGRASLTGPNTAVGAGIEAGASGTITVTGAGSVLEAGSSILISADDDPDTFVNDGVLLPDEVVTAGLGEATLRIAEGGAAMADQVYVGENGTLDADGTLAGDTRVSGVMKIGAGGTGALGLTGDLTLMPGAELEFGVAEFDSDTGGTIAVDGDADFGLSQLRIDLRVLDPSVAPGDAFRLATVTGTFEPGLRIFLREDEAFSLATVGSDLVLTALDLAGDDALAGTAGADGLLGGVGQDTLTGDGGDDILAGGAGPDTLIGGDGADRFQFFGDPFDGADVSADGRQIVGGEDFIEDFDFGADAYAIDAGDFGIAGDVAFAALDANAPGAEVPAGTNVIVLENADNDADPETEFLAGTAAAQIAGLVDDPGAGLFVYWNSVLGVNRLVYSSDLSDAEADLKIVARQTDLAGQDAIDALGAYSAENFVFETRNDAAPVAVFDIAAVDAVRAEGDAGASAFTFTVTRTGSTAGDAAVSYLVSGTGADPAGAADFAGAALPEGRIDFADGEDSARLTVEVGGDGVIEPDETFEVGLSNPSVGTIGTAVATGTIVNDDVFGPVAPSDGVIRGTGRDDALASGAGAIYLPGDGVDTFLISAAAAAGETAVLDASAGDVVQLAGGLDIVSSTITPTALSLDLATGARVQVLNADAIVFEPGGNVTTGAAGPELSYADFAAQVLGESVPASGSATSGVATVPEATGTDPVMPVIGPPSPTEGVIRGTGREDTLVIGTGAIYLPGGGPDTAIISPAATLGETAVFDGATGDTVQFVGGLEIAEFVLTPTALAITLETGAAIQVLGAPSLVFEPGGNATTAEAGPGLDYESFAQSVLGAAVPDDGVVTGGPVVIGDPGAGLVELQEDVLL